MLKKINEFPTPLKIIAQHLMETQFINNFYAFFFNITLV